MNIKNLYRKMRYPLNGIKAGLRQTVYTQHKLILEQNILFKKEAGITDRKYYEGEIVVSLTTYGKRIYDVALTIESIMEQTLQANRIILWLDYSFQGKRLPEALHKLEKRGLEIDYCADLRSYKKLIPSLHRFPNDVIITVDDDVLYNYDMLETLIHAYLDEPTCIWGNRCHTMKVDKQGRVASYLDWELCSSDLSPNLLTFPTGVGGILYPPHSLDEEVINEKSFMELCPYADDIWFKAMALKKGTMSRKAYTPGQPGGDVFLINEGVQDMALANENMGGECRNNVQLDAVFRKYNLFTHLNGNN